MPRKRAEVQQWPVAETTADYHLDDVQKALAEQVGACMRLLWPTGVYPPAVDALYCSVVELVNWTGSSPRRRAATRQQTVEQIALRYSYIGVGKPESVDGADLVAVVEAFLQDGDL